VGREGRLQFWGASFVSDPYGNVMRRASHDAEEIVVVPCDLGLVDTARTHWPFLRDRRIDAYDGILKRYLGAP
jgi:N-carbamoylputrescine amidase